MATDGGQKRGWPWWGCSLVMLLPLLLCGLASGSDVVLTELADSNRNSNEEVATGINVDYVVLTKLFRSLSEPGEPSNARVWPELEFGLRVVLGSIIGFLGAALGSIGGVGGGGIFVPMLTLIIGFDPKTSTAMSKCMIMGAAGSTVYYNRRLRHPTMDLPIIDYDLALLFQPMLMLGISIGVAFNVMFPEWMVTVLLIVLFLGTSTKALFKGIETWKKESIMKMEAAAKLMASSAMNESPEMEYKAIQGGPTINMQSNSPSDEASPNNDYNLSRPSPKVRNCANCVRILVPVKDNVYWKELIVLVSVWVAFLAIQAVKTYATTCSLEYWVLNALQVPIALGVTIYEAYCLCQGKRTIASRGNQEVDWKAHQLLIYCCFGVLAGIVGGLLGLGGGFILGPLFLEMGVPPQVASATSTLVMTFSSSMSVIQYYLLDRFPIPYATYFIFLATVAAYTGQHIVRRLIVLLGRASLIIFVLALTIFVSAISLGGVGIANMVEKMERNEHMGFENLCHHP